MRRIILFTMCVMPIKFYVILSLLVCFEFIRMCMYTRIEFVNYFERMSDWQWVANTLYEHLLSIQRQHVSQDSFTVEKRNDNCVEYIVD